LSRAITRIKRTLPIECSVTEVKTTNFKTDLVAAFEPIFHDVLCHRRPSCHGSMKKSRAHALSPQRSSQAARALLPLCGSIDPKIQTPKGFELVRMPETSRIQ
jgi:hypothetical protein